MKHVKNTYVEFFVQRALFAESMTNKVKTRDVSKIKVPKNAFRFRFFDKHIYSETIGGKELKKEEITDESPVYYYGGKVYTIAKLKREFPDNEILIENAKSNGYKKVIRCRTGNWQLFNKTDVLIEAT